MARTNKRDCKNMDKVMILVTKIYNFIKARFYINETIILYQLTKHNVQCSPAIIKKANESNINDILSFQPQKYIEIFNNFLKLGDVGYFAYIKNICVHRSWVKANEQIVHPHEFSPYKLKKNEIFIHYCETALSSRGKNIYSHTLSTIIQENQDKTILISVDEKNIASKKAVKKVGFQERERESSSDIWNQNYQKNELRVMIITMGLSRIVEPIVKSHNVIGIIESAPRKNYTKKQNLLFYVLKNVYSVFKKQAKTLKTYASEKKIPYYYMDNGSDKKLENWVKEKAPDVIVIYSMSQLLKENIFKIPKYQTINLHPAFLPSYRGPNPDFWMYYNQEKQGGVTLHYVDESEDTGDIIYQEKYDFPLGLKSPEMLDLSIGQIGVGLILKALANIENLPRIKQPKASPTKKARNIKDSEHKQIINWQSWKTERVWHILRGTQSWLNALERPKGIYKSQRWQIENYEKCDIYSYEISKIYKENKKYFVVCSDGKIYLKLKFNIKNFILYLLG